MYISHSNGPLFSPTSPPASLASCARVYIINVQQQCEIARQQKQARAKGKQLAAFGHDSGKASSIHTVMG